MSQISKKFGYIPDTGDINDYKFLAKLTPKELPKIVDNSKSQFMPGVVDQGDLGSCTANAGGSMFQYVDQKIAGVPTTQPSRLKLYYDTRLIEHQTKFDSGAMIRDVMKAMVKQGVCPESMWPYDITKFTKRAPRKCYDEAKKHQALQYQRVNQTEFEMKSCLADGNLIIIGFSVYESFMTQQVATSGMMPMPKPGERVIGGHCTLKVGYSDDLQCWLVRNSWGKNWGKSGYFWMPYDYSLNTDLSTDFWTLLSVEH